MATKKKPTTKKVTVEYKKLYRSDKDKMIAGVCAGLGNYFGIEPILIRLIFILITLFGGGGVLIYLILWLIIPSESSQGSISEENIKINADEIKLKAQEFANSAKIYADKKGNKKTFGLILLILGIIFLANNFQLFFPLRFFIKFWPLIFIALAIYLLRKND